MLHEVAHCRFSYSGRQKTGNTLSVQKQNHENHDRPPQMTVIPVKARSVRRQGKIGKQMNK